jgi:hypothetical protein
MSGADTTLPSDQGNREGGRHKSGTKPPLALSYPPPSDGKLQALGGSRADAWNETLLVQACQALYLEGATDAERSQRATAAMAALIGIAPADALEGMIAGQLVAAHHAAMDCYRRAAIPGQTPQGRHDNLARR